MRRIILLVCLPALLPACGGGGGGGPEPLFSELSGQLSVVAQQQLLSAPEPSVAAAAQGIATAQLFGTPEGDLGDGGTDVFRRVAGTFGVIRGSVEHGDVDVVLFNLTSGAAGRAVPVEQGNVYDIIVRGSGRYRVVIEDAAVAEVAELPEAYAELGDGVEPGEIVAAAGEGVSAQEIARALDADWIAGDGSLFLLRLRGAVDADPLREACRLLCCCTHLAADGLVRFAEPNYRRRLALNANDPRFLEQWALQQVRAPAAWTLTTGSSQVVVAVIDSGVQEGHVEMTGRLLPGYDFVDGDDDPHDETRSMAHGTSVAGIVGAATNNSEGVAGLNWDARIVPVRAFGASGFSTSFDIGQAIRFAAGLDNTSGMVSDPPARVINMSFASGVPSTAEENACVAARAEGVLLVAASGNDGKAIQQYPAAYPSVLAVGATRRSGGVASYSNYGAYIELAAPGGLPADGVLVASFNFGDFTYIETNGTSFAAPHVSGVAALVLSVAPGLGVDALRQLLIDTAQDIGAPGFDTRSGHGLVDAHAAVLAALGQVPGPGLIPEEVVEVRLVQVATGKTVFSATTTEAQLLRFSFARVGSGEYFLIAGTDRNFDGDIVDAGEVTGQWQGRQGPVLTVLPQINVVDLDFAITPK